MTPVAELLDTYRRFNLPLIYWKRVGTDPKEWKGPHDKGWNNPKRVYDLSRYDPALHNLGTLTGQQIAPGKYLADSDFDKQNPYFAKKLYPATLFAVNRPGKDLSHLLYTTPAPVISRKEYKSRDDTQPYIELRGTRFQTMLPPSLHTPPDVHVSLLVADTIGHTDVATLQQATLDYAIASLVCDDFPKGLHHDERLALAGYLLKQSFADDRVVTLLQTICGYQVQCRVPDMSEYDVKDAEDVVTSTVARLKHQEKISGWAALREINADFLKHLQTWLHDPSFDGPVTVEDFYAYMPTHTYLFIPNREYWPSASVNARVGPIADGKDENGEPTYIAANTFLDRHRPVDQAIWAPGLPLLIRDKLVSDGGWKDRPGCACVNLYAPPQIVPGDPTLADPWLEHLRNVYPEHVDHVVQWLAHRVQYPHIKINHGLVCGGHPGIGKDTILEPVKAAIGPWNFKEISPQDLFEPFNPFIKSVILRVNEARDLGDANRYTFYERMKIYLAAPPDVIECNDKNIRKHAVFNVCGVILTTNYQTDGLFLPANDRRHYVMWSTRTAEDFVADYWIKLYDWYKAGGTQHVAAYLARYDLSTFDPKAPPLKTPAFWDIVDANRAPENADLADALDEMGNPEAFTLSQLIECAPSLSDLLTDRKNARQVPHRLSDVGYVSFRNPTAKDGLWKIGGKRQVVYVQETLTITERHHWTQALIDNPPPVRLAPGKPTLPGM